MALALVPIFLILFVFLPSNSTPFAGVPEKDLASSLAGEIRTLPTVQGQACPSVSRTIANTLTILQDMDRTMGTGFGAIQFDASNCDIVMQFLPLIGTYDSLIRSSTSFDPNNSTSVKLFYENLFLMSSNFIIINDAVGYKLAFKSTGELNDALGLSTLRSVCGSDCYSVVLSGIHWTIRVYMDQFLCRLEGWASKYVQLIPYASC